MKIINLEQLTDEELVELKQLTDHSLFECRNCGNQGTSLKCSFAKKLEELERERKIICQQKIKRTQSCRNLHIENEFEFQELVVGELLLGSPLKKSRVNGYGENKRPNISKLLKICGGKPTHCPLEDYEIRSSGSGQPEMIIEIKKKG
ncbi:24231_t:CDS:2, partial [Racocetra persica]